MEYPRVSNNGERAMKAARHNNHCGGTHQGDRLSSLPDHILVEILSLLPIKTAVTTGVLSQRWLGLWTQTPILDLDSSDISSIEIRKFFSIGDHILRQLTSPQICKFKLHVRSTDYWGRLCSDSQPWISQICSSPTVKEVELIFDKITDTRMLLPSSVFRCRSLVALNLYHLGFQFRVPDKINLPNLKRFCVRLYDCDSELVGKLFRCCPLLEEFSLQGSFFEDEPFIEISSAQNLKRLTLHLWVRGEKSIKVSIDAPKLIFLDMYDFYGFNLRFVKQPSSSLEMHIIGTTRPRGVNTIMKLFPKVSNIRSLTLDSLVIRDHDSWDDSKPPTLFHNMSSLAFSMHSPKSLKVLLCLLHCTPNLDFLIIRDGRFGRAEISSIISDSPPVCLLTHIKRIQIGLMRGSEDDLKLVKYLLCNANALECLTVELFGGSVSKDVQLQKELSLYEDLCKLPKSSPSCVIEVHSSDEAGALRF